MVGAEGYMRVEKRLETPDVAGREGTETEDRSNNYLPWSSYNLPPSFLFSPIIKGEGGPKGHLADRGRRFQDQG